MFKCMQLREDFKKGYGTSFGNCNEEEYGWAQSPHFGSLRTSITLKV